jgi:transposase
VCCSLLSSTSSKGRSGELSDLEHGPVIGCHISKKSIRDIATLLTLPKSAVHHVIVKWKREGTTTTKPPPSRPRLMTDRDRQALKKVVHETRQTWNETITHEFCSAMSFHRQAAAHKPNISPVNAKHHLKWFKEHCLWTVDNWKCAIWSDKSCYVMWPSDGRVWVWRMPGECYQSALPTVKFGGDVITVWGCFS